MEKTTEDNILLYCSLVINGMLVLTTGMSEIFGASKCKYNGLFDMMVQIFTKTEEEIEGENLAV